MDPADAPLDSPETAGHADRVLAIRNAGKLTLSLLFTWGVALGVRVLLPRFLGPERFGDYNFSDAFTASFLIALALGVEPYVYRAVAVRPGHASEFFGTVTVLRAAIAGLLVAAMAVALHVTHRPDHVRVLVWTFTAAQFLMATNATLAAMLQARSTVDGLSVVNVAAKCTWAIGVFVAVATRAELWAFVAPSVASEALKTVALWVLARRHLRLAFRVDVRATRAVLAASVAFYVNSVALAVFARIDVTILGVVGSSREVGFYGAAAGVAGLAMLVTPIMGSVLFPLLSRAAARSPDELDGLVRRATEAVFALAIPIALFIALGADLWLGVLYGNAFEPAVVALRILAPALLVTYLNMLASYWLIVLNRTWTVTIVTLVGIATDAALNLALLRPVMGWLARPGAGGAACAAAMLGSELVVAVALFRSAGRSVLDRRAVARVAKTLAAAAAAIAADRVASGVLPVARVAIDVLVYLAVVLATGAVTPAEIRALAREVLPRRGGRSPAA